MNKRLKMTLLTMTGLLAMPLASCGNEIVDNGQVITMWYAFNADYEEQLNIAARSFQAKYPEYVFQPHKVTGSYDDLKQAVLKGIAGGNYPDIVVAYPDAVAEFVGTLKALNMDTYMNDSEIGWTVSDFDDIPTEYIEEGQKYKLSGTYSLPLCKSSEALYYNADKLINLDLSSIDDDINGGNKLDETYLNNLTWEELFGSLCPAIAKYDSIHPEEKLVEFTTAEYQEAGAIVGYDSDDNFFITLAQQYGLPYTSVNEISKEGSVDFVIKNEKGEAVGVEPGYMNVMKMINVACQDHVFNEKTYRYLTTTNVLPGKTRTNNIFTHNNGGMLFSIGSTGGTTYQDSKGKFDVGVAYLPTAEGSSRAAINQGPSCAFLKRGATKELWQSHAKGAWLYYKELTSKEMNAKWAKKTGYSPIRNSVIDDVDYKEYASVEGKTPNTKAMLDARNATLVMNNVENLFSTVVYNGSAAARNAVGAVISDIFKHGKMPTDPEDPDYATKEAAFEAVVLKYFQDAFALAINF